ncbi:MAG: 50S ribosomal protein L19 [Rickettsiales bacterium]|jgi:large subunit ribosomal protein L19|nr:50S ribosomal protein L19 [Rickettsiales bacterium]
MNLIDKFNNTQLKTLTENKTIPNFKAGDTVKVGVRISEGKNERIQYFQGLCIARKSQGLHSSFTVRKVTGGEGVERNFPIHSKKIESIEVLKQGVVRRAKLYYIRELSGKSARIREKITARVNKPKKQTNSSKDASVTKAEVPDPKS